MNDIVTVSIMKVRPGDRLVAFPDALVRSAAIRAVPVRRVVVITFDNDIRYTAPASDRVRILSRKELV